MKEADEAVLGHEELVVRLVGSSSHLGRNAEPLAAGQLGRFSVRQQLDVIIEMSRWDGCCGWTTWVAASTNWLPVGLGARVIEEVYAPRWVGPRVAGSSHFPASRGRARRVERGWILSGGPWTFGSDALWAPYTNLGCIAKDGEESYLVGAQVPRGPATFPR